jgi:cytochrome c oxidase assembly protein subunit 15
VRRRLTPFQRLALGTTAITYLLILVGGLVRASGAGLGCPDWPRCFGSWTPPTSVADLPPQFDPSLFNPTLMWTEYLNRLLGVTVGFFVLATVASAWRYHRHDRHILWPAVAALLLTGYEGWLGGRVVAHELAPWIVTVHMIVALVIVSLLLYATVYAFYAPRWHAAGGRDRRVLSWPEERNRLSIGAIVLIVVTLIQVAIGTQVREGVDHALDAGTSRAEALSTVGWLDYLHRDSALAVLGLALVLMLMVWANLARTRAIERSSYAVVALAGAQVLLGGVMAYIALAPVAQILHLTLAALLLGAETVTMLLVWWEQVAGDPEGSPPHISPPLRRSFSAEATTCGGDPSGSPMSTRRPS